MKAAKVIELESPIKEIRLGYHMTQAKLAALAGISPSYLSEIESGLHPIPDKIIALLGKTHVNVSRVVERHAAFMEHIKRRLEEEFLGIDSHSEDTYAN